MSGTVVAPNIITYSSHTPYLTYDEWNTAATSVDTSNLIAGGTTAQQQQAVTNAIERASSWVDKICHMVLAATADTHQGYYRVSPQGTVRVPLPYKPILEVSNIQVGLTPSSLTLLTDVSDVFISEHGVVEIPIVSASFSSYGNRFNSGSKLLVRLNYVNGFPNTYLTSASLASATSLVFASSLGIYPGRTLTVYDVAAGNEQVTIGSGFVAGSLTVPLVGSTAFAHAAKISVSNLPPVVKEAAILLTTTLIQTRGDDAIMLASLDPQQMSSSAAGVAKSSERIAEDILGDLVRVR
jgi:hypothetical protein